MNANSSIQAKRGALRQRGLGNVEWLLVLAGMWFGGSWLAAQLREAGEDRLNIERCHLIAQHVERVAHNAVIAGVAVVAHDGVEGALERLAEGRRGVAGAFEGEWFQVAALRDVEPDAVAKLLRIEHGHLIYTP